MRKQANIGDRVALKYGLRLAPAHIVKRGQCGTVTRVVNQETYLVHFDFYQGPVITPRKALDHAFNLDQQEEYRRLKFRQYAKRGDAK